MCTELCAALVGVGIVLKSGSHYHLDKGNACGCSMTCW